MTFSGFVYVFSRDMFRAQGEHKGPRARSVYLPLYILSVISELQAELLGYIIYLCPVLDEFDPPENDDGPDVQRPFPVFAEAFVVYAEGSLVVLPDGVDLVACFTAMKVQFSVLIAIVVVEGHAVRIAVIAENGQNSPRLFLKDADALVV